jgi:single-stranded-DNA-specific exonuclease
MPYKNWDIKPQAPSPQVAQLAQALTISPELANILVQRGISSFDQAKDFFRPNYEQLHNPLLMADMPAAIQRLHSAIQNQEHILVYGDYDVDGTTSVSMVYHFLTNHTKAIASFYIPDRYTEGYGVQKPGIDHAIANNIGLIIALDCGIKSVELVAYAKANGVDFIICDHHRPGTQLPPAIAVLDPKRADCPYPYKELTGCGVGFKLLTAYCQHAGIDTLHTLPYLDLVVTSIACDIVPVTGENRTLAYYGLQHINQNPRTGIKALVEASGPRKTMNITDVVFGLGPRINAAGRISHANHAVNLLLSTNETESTDFTKIINEHNNSRKSLDTNITTEALQMIESNPNLQQAKSTVLFKSDWHKGVIGIVASRCIEQYHRPTIILTQANGHAAGSARSVPGFDLYEAIEACSQHLIQFGGHTFAAGLSLEIDKIDDFRAAFEQIVAERIQPEQLIPSVGIDMELDLHKIDPKFVRILEQMAPFGPQNMAPIFMAQNVKLHNPPRILKEKHLKLTVYQEGSQYFDAIGFGMVPDFYETLTKAETFSLCYQVEFNEFRGEKSIQLLIKDIKT